MEEVHLETAIVIMIAIEIGAVVEIDTAVDQGELIHLKEDYFNLLKYFFI